MKTIWSRAAGGIELVTQEFGATDSSLAFHIPRPEDGAFSIRELPREDALALAAAIQAHYGAQPERPAEVPIPSGWAIRALATGGGPCDRCGQPLWTHVCLSCSPDYQTPGPGCGNCRNTGMDQTPCRPAQEGGTTGD